MMEFFQAASKILMIPSFVMFIYDLCYFWFVKNMVKLQTTKEWINKIAPGLYSDFHSLMLKIGPTGGKIEALPGCVMFFAPALTFYLIYRLIFVLQGGKAGGYKSRY